MLVKHLKREFYSTLFGKRLLILANFDVDSVCTSKVLMELLRADAIAYSFVPVDGLTAMRKAYFEYSHTVQIVILINCGVSMDLLAILNNPTDKIFYVLDSHRPIHIANFYNETQQVRVLAMEDKVDIPEFDEIFRPNYDSDEEASEDELDDDENDVNMESSDDDTDASDGMKRTKRKRKHITVESRRERREWEERRHDLLFQYSQFRYHAPPSALLALELAWSLGRQDIQYVWWSIVALTDSLVMERIPRREYTLKITDLHSHIARIANSQQNTPRDCLKVTFEKELCFSLYRHWNLYDSIKMTPHTASMLKTFSLKGENRFHEMLGELGLPLVQCKQKYNAMELRFKRKVKEAFTSSIVKDKYKIEDTAIASFVAEIGFRSKFSAFDSQYACFALLENPDVSLTPTERFMHAFDSLTKSNHVLQEKGFDIAKMFIKATFRQVQAFINTNTIRVRGGYLIAHVPEGAPDISFFANTCGLIYLAQFTQHAAVASSRSRRWGTLPIVLTCPASKEWTSIVGIKPSNFDIPKNLFGKLFETIAEKMPGQVIIDAMEPHVVQVLEDHKEEFLTILEACLL